MQSTAPTDGPAPRDGLRARWAALPLGWRRVPLWILLGLVLLQPTPHRVGSTVVGDLGDSMFLTWTLSWGARALRTDPLGAFDAPIFHPEPQTLALSDPMLSVAPLFGLIEWITGDSIAALNLTMFLLFVMALASAHVAKEVLNPFAKISKGIQNVVKKAQPPPGPGFPEVRRHIPWARTGPGPG